MNTTKRASFASTVMIVVACVILDVALHRLSAWMFDFNYFNNGLPQSVLVKNGTFPIVASISFSVMFGFLALNYSCTRSEIGGTRFWAGQRFFAPFAFIMFFGVLESAFVFPTPFEAEIITAIADAVPYLVLGVLLSYVFSSGTNEESGQEAAAAPWQSMLWIGIFYVAGRYLISYPVLHITSGYIERAAGTFAWTVGCGLSMGSFYWLAGSTFSAATPMRKALRVGGLTLGIFWLMVQLFFALISEVSVSDLVIRAIADIVYLVAGIYSFEKLFRGRLLTES
ncbi:MAG: hypothetical protein HXX15_09780 [Rhodopseudomonas sp.]|uniref:hypothetical protein n=1 Tax=Rhodopseudomonas sp. TaxID=1078 RepID=UPI001844B546|nr:hypothetical protein [Rhodopseudomonas sp.]NVN86362.1 hypothetical protein [Rhodopseudomonas sp.]